MSQDEKDRTSAAILAILLGSFGAHRFYMGQVALGFLYLIFFWTYIPGIVGLVEGLIYLTMSDDEFAEKFDISTQVTIPAMKALEKLHELQEDGVIDDLEYESLSHEIDSSGEVPLEPFHELQKVTRLSEKGALSEEQVEQRKARILDELRGG